MSFGKGDAPQRPQYEQWQGNAYTDQANDLLTQGYNFLTGNMGNINTFSPEVQQGFQGIANQYTQAQWNDLNRSYTENMNKLNQRNYNRFGTTGATGSLYDTQSLQNQYNDLASRVASNTASMYNDLINNEYNKRMNTINFYNNLYNQAGNILSSKDIANWKIRNTNLENKYLTDVDNYNNQGSVLGLIGNTLLNGLQGFTTAGPWGAVGGAVGGATSYLGNYNL